MASDLTSAKLVFENVAPLVGETSFQLTGPGLYALVAPNASGKSHRLRLLEKAGDIKALGQLHAITDGEEEAVLEVGQYAVRFRRNPRRGQKPVEETGAPPMVEPIPGGIATLINGGNLKGEEPRARARLEALLGYVPVEGTAERLAGMLRCVDLDIPAEIEPQVRRVWQRIGQEIAVPRSPWMPLELGEEIAAAVRAEVAPGSPVLQAHSVILDRLNALGLRAEKIAAAHAVEVGAVGGEVAAQLAAAADAFGLAPDAVGLSDRLAACPSAIDAERSLRDAEHDRAMVEAAHQRVIDETARRERLRSTHGPRPDVEAAAGAALLANAEAARLAEIEAAEVAKFEAIAAQLEAARREVEVAKVKRAAASREALAAADAHAAAKAAYERWRAVQTQLSERIIGPSDEELAAARRAVERARETERAAAAAARWREASARRDQAAAIQSAIEGLATDYRRSAQDSWSFLGEAVTKALALPWLRVDGMRIEVGYQRSGKTAPLATAEAPAQDWRDLDDEERISSAELRDAMLSLMLERHRGSWLVLPWADMLAFEDERLLDLARRVEAAGIVAFFERPRRKGEADHIVMEKL